MVLGMDSATCVSSQQFDATTIQSVEAIIGAVQGQTMDEMKVKEPETETVQEELEQPKADPDLEEAMEVLKEKQEQKNLYTGLVIGSVTGLAILVLLVSILKAVDCYQYNINILRWASGCGDVVPRPREARRACGSRADRRQGASTHLLAHTLSTYQSLR